MTNVWKKLPYEKVGDFGPIPFEKNQQKKAATLDRKRPPGFEKSWQIFLMLILGKLAKSWQKRVKKRNGLKRFKLS
ncbi:hypothetical protein LK430_04275 [Acidaminococcus fermentans DSM 20731]|uniref:hypothetical protein n=1 Tax=Acidaminococcus fermentans TaxID=905 RepID=UPI0011D149A6|nr:hypothetical protein [Acidaminococcus fermentans]UEA73136.1 hypothetical protein LK430_04275 [Acidaminococcus fermentans DSM 20731]